MARARRRFRHCTGERRRARDSRRRSGESRVHRTRDQRLRALRRPRTSPTRSSTRRRRPASRASASRSWRTRTRARPARNSAGRSASPSTTTRSTTSARSSTSALLTGHVGRYGSGVCPLRGQNNVQGGGDMGAITRQLSRRTVRRRSRTCERSSSARGAAGCRPRRDGTSRRCSRPSNAENSIRSTSR